MKILFIILMTASSISYGADFTVQFSSEDNSISTTKIQDGSVTSSKLADGSVDDSKVSSISSSKIVDLSTSVSNILNNNFPDWTQGNSSAGVLITALTTNPSYGTVQVNNFQYKKERNQGYYMWNFQRSTGGVAGNGNYLINLPPGQRIDLTKFGRPQNFVDSGFTLAVTVPGHMSFRYPVSGDTSPFSSIYVYDETRLYVYTENGSGTRSIWSNTWFDLAYSTAMNISAEWSVPLLP